MKHWLEDELPFREILDCGLKSYDEFACSNATLSYMKSIGWPKGGYLQVVDVCHGGHNVIVKAWPKEGR